jgi:hypothetical protein
LLFSSLLLFRACFYRRAAEEVALAVEAAAEAEVQPQPDNAREALPLVVNALQEPTEATRPPGAQPLRRIGAIVEMADRREEILKNWSRTTGSSRPTSPLLPERITAQFPR